MFVQVKATDKLKWSKKNKGYQLRLDMRDLELWSQEVPPILIVLYDAKNDVGYFLELGEHFSENRLILNAIHKSKLVFIPPDNVFNPAAIQKYRQKKNS